MERERIIWIDYSKVILICLVVFAHSPFVPHMLDTFICGFHMLAFLLFQDISNYKNFFWYNCNFMYSSGND